MSTVLFHSRRGSAGSGRPGSPVASGSTLCVSPVVSHSSHVGESEDTAPVYDPSGPRVGLLEVGHSPASVRPALAVSAAQGPADSGGRRDIPPAAGRSRPLGLARERLNLDAEGLPQNVIDTIQCARAQSTRDAYDVKWRVFEDWCSPDRVVPFQASVRVVLSFLQDLLDRGRAFSTVKVYLAAISACHIGFGDKPVGQHPLVRQFMKGANHLRPVSKSLVPSWDLALVLDSLSRPPFEPLEGLELKLLSLKTALLLALVTAKRVSDIHALSTSAECMRFNGCARVVMKTNPAFLPKNRLATPVPVELAAFCPPPFASEEDRRRHNLCPVRALRMYLDKTEVVRKTTQLFVSWDPKTVGQPISKVRLSQWIVEAIERAYSSRDLVPPVGLRAHSTRGMAASWALCRGVSIQDVCSAASWASSSTFATFYRLDVTAAPVAHAVLGVASK